MNISLKLYTSKYIVALFACRRMMPLTTEHQLTIEKTPSYFVTTNAAERVYQMSPDVRLIVVLRDPVSRALSDYAQASAKKPGLPRFERLAFRTAADDNGRVFGFRVGNQTYGEVNSTWRALQIGLYDVHLRRWTKHFRRDRIHFVSGERLVSDPASTVAEVQRFLGLRPAITGLNFRSSAFKPGFPCLVRNPETTKSVVRCLGKTKGRRHPDVDERAVERLREFFRPHNEKLYRMTGVDFEWQ